MRMPARWERRDRSLSSASMAACPRATGPCNFLPTCSTFRSTARQFARRPRLASLFWPAGKPACTRRRTAFPGPGAWTGPFGRRCPIPTGANAARAGAMRWRAPCWDRHNCEISPHRGCDDAKSIQRVRALHALKRRFERTALNVKWQFPLRSYRPEHRQTTACSDSVRRYPAACKARSHPSAPRRKRAGRRQRSLPR